jgi:hypothetical protein
MLESVLVSSFYATPSPLGVFWKITRRNVTKTWKTTDLPQTSTIVRLADKKLFNGSGF